MPQKPEHRTGQSQELVLLLIHATQMGKRERATTKHEKGVTLGLGFVAFIVFPMLEVRMASSY